ncbi:iron-sulfur cluster assembly scaffold protein [Panacagrimonas sp.]|uniref:iron-sulfur cluster assembly scaffold protein n=1 Tax=Panacagrimonas sp. TaxID=2480088 RepID=UPI003B5238C8
MNNPLGYPERVWTLFQQAPNAGTLAPAPDVRTIEADSTAHRFRLRVQVKTCRDRIEVARFQALGCPYTIATGAWLTLWLTDRAPAEITRGLLAELRAALEIPEDRAHCWVMAQDVLRALNPDVSS